MEEQMHHAKQEIALLRRERSRVQESFDKEFELKQSQRVIEQMKSKRVLLKFEAELRLFAKRSGKRKHWQKERRRNPSQRRRISMLQFWLSERRLS
jgi:lipid II:glycine glycyltransferase (peptidoglycan interpeptide bridge formation enzyme)